MHPFLAFLAVFAGTAEFFSVGLFFLVGGAVTCAWLCGFLSLWPGAVAAWGIILGLSKYFARGTANTARANMKGKVVLVTGGATGIGLQTVRELAKMGATVILAARGGPARLASAVAAAKAGLEPSAASGITAMSLDLSSFLSIHSFVQEFLAEHTRLHLLINNAGIMACPYGLTEDGLELQMGTNHFGHFLLTNLLMDTLIASRARIINVASLAHALTARFTYPRQNDRARYDKDTAYADSKLANIYFTLELERRFGSKGVHSYALHPGFVATELMKHAPRALQLLLPPLQYFTFKTSLEGAQTTLFCALSDRAIPGGYHSDAQPWPTTAEAQDKAKARWLWEESERITKLK